MVIMFLMIMTIVLIRNIDDDGNDDYNSDDGDDNNSDYSPVWTIVDDKEMITTGNN